MRYLIDPIIQYFQGLKIQKPTNSHQAKRLAAFSLPPRPKEKVQHQYLCRSNFSVAIGLKDFLWRGSNVVKLFRKRWEIVLFQFLSLKMDHSKNCHQRPIVWRFIDTMNDLSQYIRIQVSSIKGQHTFQQFNSIHFHLPDQIAGRFGER